MKKNILIIIVEGKYPKEFDKENNYIVISNKEPDEELEKIKWLQMNFENPEEMIKALEILKIEFGKIDKMKIIYNNQKLNMISYQFDYEFLKKIYLTQTANLFYFVSLIIPFFNKKMDLELIAGDFSYYQIHNKNWINSTRNFLTCLKKDLEPDNKINLI